MAEDADQGSPTSPTSPWGPPTGPTGSPWAAPAPPPPYQGPPPPPYQGAPPPPYQGPYQDTPQPGYGTMAGYGAPAAYPVAPGYGGSLLPVPPHALASPGQRLVGALLSVVLLFVTLFIGYIIWAAIAWTNSTTPAKQVLGLRVVDARSGAPATFGQMVMRQLVWSLVLVFGSSATLGVLGIVDALFVFGNTRQRLLDKMSNTLVVR